MSQTGVAQRNLSRSAPLQALLHCCRRRRAHGVVHSYLRNGTVVDLRVGAGQIDALVAGGLLYEVSVRIDKLARRRWGALIERSAGRIDSVVELLRGRFPEAVLEALVEACRSLPGATGDQLRLLLPRLRLALQAYRRGALRRWGPIGQEARAVLQAAQRGPPGAGSEERAPPRGTDEGRARWSRPDGNLRDRAGPGAAPASPISLLVRTCW